MDFEETGSKFLTSSTKFVFLCQSVIQDGHPALWLTEAFLDFFSATTALILTKFDRKLVPSVLYQVCDFHANHSSKLAALVLDWPNCFFFLLLHRNLFMYFEETWQEVSPQRPLPSCVLAHLSRRLKWAIVIARCPSSLRASGVNFHIFDFSEPLNRFWPNLTGCKNSTSSTKCALFLPIVYLDGHPPLWLTETFSPSFLQRQNRFWWNLTRNKSLTSTTKGVYMVYIIKRPPFLDDLESLPETNNNNRFYILNLFYSSHNNWFSCPGTSLLHISLQSCCILLEFQKIDVFFCGICAYFCLN